MCSLSGKIPKNDKLANPDKMSSRMIDAVRIPKTKLPRFIESERVNGAH